MAFPEGGDAYMARCLWRLGFPVTDPGYTPLGRYARARTLPFR